MPRPVIGRHVEQTQQGRQGRFQGFIEGNDSTRHLCSDLAQVVSVLDLEVALEELDDGQIARSLGVGDTSTPQYEPALQRMRVGKFIGKARLAHASLAHEGGNLAATFAGKLQKTPELFELGIATHKVCEPPSGGRLQAGPDLAGPNERVDLYRIG